ncbi:hypothetical protein Patl1_15754 [Pistacia atlantica]|uniref:Uncharacterized protein n=1 Tax=Pistacia atlantica TaxID=434234 RepID=A0ACC1B887_9ROSI|nr:hypothetical protein Patl1_15754 [Pistacia atlantica]
MSERNDCHSTKVYNGKEVRKKQDDGISKGRPGSSSTLDLIKKKLQDSRTPVTSLAATIVSGTVASELNGFKAVEDPVKGLPNENSKEKLKDANGDSKHEMLKERGVAPFSKWEKELPKVVFDPRFKVCRV